MHVIIWQFSTTAYIFGKAKILDLAGRGEQLEVLKLCANNIDLPIHLSGLPNKTASSLHS